MNNIDISPGVFSFEISGKSRINLNGAYPPRHLTQPVGEKSQAGAYLKDKIIIGYFCRCNDPLKHPLIDQEVLPQPFITLQPFLLEYFLYIALLHCSPLHYFKSLIIVVSLAIMVSLFKGFTMYPATPSLSASSTMLFSE